MKAKPFLLPFITFLFLWPGHAQQIQVLDIDFNDLAASSYFCPLLSYPGHPFL